MGTLLGGPSGIGTGTVGLDEYGDWKNAGLTCGAGDPSFRGGPCIIHCCVNVDNKYYS